MDNLTLAQVFGTAASQTSTTLTITKSDLSGLTASSSNTGEQLLVALLLKARESIEGNLTDPSGQNLTDQLSRIVTYNNSELYEKLKIFHWKRQFITRNQQPSTLDTFVINAFFNPPPAFGAAINLALWG